MRLYAPLQAAQEEHNRLAQAHGAEVSLSNASLMKRFSTAWKRYEDALNATKKAEAQYENAQGEVSQILKVQEKQAQEAQKTNNRKLVV